MKILTAQQTAALLPYPALAEALRHQVQALLVFGVGLGLTSLSLWLLSALAPDASRWVEVGVLTAANLFVTVMRFVAMRVWIFSRRSRSVPSPV